MALADRESLNRQVGEILDKVSDAILYVDGDWRITYVNGQAERLLGESRKELIGVGLWSKLKMTEGLAFEKLRQAMGERKPYRFEESYLGKWLEVNAHPIGPGLCIFLHDITERRLLGHSEKRFRAIANTAVDAILSFDLEGRITFCNRAAARMFGYSRKELCRQNVAVVMPERYKKLFRSDTEMFLATGRSYYVGQTWEAEALRRDGSEFPVELSRAAWRSDDTIFFSAIIRDVTKRRQALEQLRDEEERYRVLFERSPDGVVIVDPGTGLPLEFNEAAHRNLGYSREEFAQLHVADYEVVEDLGEIRAHIAKVLSEGSDSFETRHRTKQGEIRDVLVTIQTIELAGRQVLFSLRRDITELKRSKEFSDALNSINSAIASTLEFEEIMQRVVVEAAKAMGCETALVYLREGDRWVVRYVYGLPADLVGRQFTEEQAQAATVAARTLAPLVVNDALSDPRVNPELVSEYGVRSLLILPLAARDEIIGALLFNYHSAPVTFSESQIDFARKLAASVSLAVENARLYGTERRAADLLQEALLAAPRHIEGVRVGALYRSATAGRKVGGDFYDVFELEHDRVGIVVGDISGKGLEAATMAALVRNSLRAYAYEEGSPASIVSKTSEVLLRTSDSAVFASVFFGVIDLRSGLLTYCSAGHPPAILRRGTLETSLLSVRSPVIGIDAELAYVNGTVALERGDTLILYTDGVVEARRESRLFGEERLVKLIGSLGKASAEDLPIQIFDEVSTYAGGSLSDDSIVLAVSLEREAKTAAHHPHRAA